MLTILSGYVYTGMIASSVSFPVTDKKFTIHKRSEENGFVLRLQCCKSQIDG